MGRIENLNFLHLFCILLFFAGGGYMRRRSESLSLLSGLGHFLNRMGHSSCSLSLFSPTQCEQKEEIPRNARKRLFVISGRCGNVCGAIPLPPPLKKSSSHHFVLSTSLTGFLLSDFPEHKRFHPIPFLKWGPQ